MGKAKLILVLGTSCLLILAIAGLAFGGTTGKVAGTVKNAQTGELLPGANVLVQGTTWGASTDQDGFYFILNMPPGAYNLTAKMIGFEQITMTNVIVSVDRTITVNFDLKPTVLDIGEEVTVEAEREIIPMDVSASQAIFSADRVTEAPVVRLEELLAYQAGVDYSTSGKGGVGLSIRGGDVGETDFQLNGMSLMGIVTNTPYIALNKSAVKEIQILTGGFNAEYGDIRSGLVNVITREGSRNRYALAFDGYYSQSGRKHFGPHAYSKNGVIWEFPTSTETAFTGVTEDMVNNPDEVDRYGRLWWTAFSGWDNIAQEYATNSSDTDNDRNPQTALELWKWRHRPHNYSDHPDYLADLSIGGPVPGAFIPLLGRILGKTTFWATYRRNRTMFVYPSSRDDFLDHNSQIKVTTQFSPSMKLSIDGLYGERYSIDSGTDAGGELGEGSGEELFLGNRGRPDGTRWGLSMAAGYPYFDIMYNLMENFIGEEYRGKLRGTWSHTLSPRTYYEASIAWDNWKTFQAHGQWRDTTGIKKIGESWYDETPFNFAESTAAGTDQLNMFSLGDGARGADFSDYQMYHFKADITSQVDKYNQAKAGYEFRYAKIKNRVKSTAGGSSWLPPPGTIPGTQWEWWDADPTQMGFYVQDKLEFRGMIANVGVRVEQMDPRHHAYDLQDRYNKNYDYNRFGDSFPIRWPEMATEEATVRWKVSPRIGISHPVTENSKVYFNYGHFYQKPFTRQLFTTQARSAAWGYPIIISNVNIDWPRTVAYELGYDHNLFDVLLLHVAGYYKDNTNELGPMNSFSYTNAIRITNYINNEYSDVRGLEFRVDKRWGRFFTFWANYNYMVRSTGTVGISTWYEDILKERDEERNVSIRAREQRPFAVPNARFNVNLHTPYRWGPVIAGFRPLESWSVDFLHTWQSGGKMLFEEAQTIFDTNKWLDRVGHHDTNLRVEKRVGQVRSFTLYMLVNNLFNRKELWRVGGTTNDNNLYRQSLKLPWDEGDEKGDDKWNMWNEDYIHLGFQDWKQFLYKRQFYFGVRMNIN